MELLEAVFAPAREEFAHGRDPAPSAGQHSRGRDRRRRSRRSRLVRVAKHVHRHRHHVLLRRVGADCVEHQALARHLGFEREEGEEFGKAVTVPSLLRHDRGVHLLHSHHRLLAQVHGGVRVALDGGVFQRARDAGVLRRHGLHVQTGGRKHVLFAQTRRRRGRGRDERQGSLGGRGVARRVAAFVRSRFNCFTAKRGRPLHSNFRTFDISSNIA